MKKYFIILAVFFVTSCGSSHKAGMTYHGGEFYLRSYEWRCYSPSNILSCMINGVRWNYDACCYDDNLKACKKWYKKYTYIGTGDTVYVRDKMTIFPAKTHFFIKTKL